MTSKKILSLILFATLLASTSSIKPVKADSMSLDSIYANAYRTTVIAMESKTQKSINTAREAIKMLPKNLDWAIGEFSKQVDTVQQPIFEKAYKAIVIAQENPTQANINAAKLAIDPDMPEYYRNSYSSATDIIQQQYMKKAIDAFNKAVQSNLQVDVDDANAIFEDIKTSNDPSIVQWVDLVQGMGDIKDLSDGGTHVSNYVISSATGVFGPADSTNPTIIKGNLLISDTNGKSITLQNMNIEGTLSINFGAGNVVINNVKVNGVTITNVGSQSLHVTGNSTISNLNVKDNNNDAHIVIEGNSKITSANVLSGATLEVANTATNPSPFGAVTIAPSSAPSQTNAVTLAGNFDNVTVARPTNVNVAEGSVLNTITANSDLTLLGPGTINNVSVGSAGARLDIQSPSVGFIAVDTNAAGATVNIASTTVVGTLNINAPTEVTGTGTVTAANIGASGTTMETRPTNVSVVSGVTATVGGQVRNEDNSTVIVQVPTTNTPPVIVTPPISGGNGGTYTPPSTVSVRSITVTGADSVANGETLQLSASISPANATNKTIVWSVASLEGGTATINSTTGMLTATGVGTVRVTATNAASGIIGTKDIRIVSMGTIKVAQELNSGPNMTSSINGYTMTFGGSIAYAQAGGDLNFPLAGNWVGLRITAPADIIPDENAELTINGNPGGTGWENIKEPGDEVNSFHIYIRARDISRVYNITIKWNNESTETFVVNFAPTTRLDVYKTDLQDAIIGAQQIYDDTAEDTNITEEARAALSTAITTAQSAYDNAVDATTDAVQSSIYEAQTAIHESISAYWDSYPTEIIATSSNIAANTTYTDEEPLIIKLKINGVGDFVTENTSYLNLGGDLSEMAIKSMTFQHDEYGNAISATLELTGTLGDSIDTKTITLSEGSVNGHSHDFATVWVEFKGTIELSQELSGGPEVTNSIDGYTMTFDGKIEYSQAGGDLNLPIAGNWVGARITAPPGILPDENSELTINGNLFGTGWENIKEPGDGDTYFHLNMRVRDIARVYNITIKWNNESTETYVINFAPTTILEIYRTDLQNTINGAQQIYDDTAEDTNITEEARAALSTAITTAQSAYDNAVNATTDTVQLVVNQAQTALQHAIGAYWDSYPTEITATSSNIAANTTYTDEEPLVITLTINGVGDFVTENISYISLGGDLSGMTMKSLTFEPDEYGNAFSATLQLSGTLGDSIENKTITLSAGSVNGHSHEFGAVWQ